MDFGDVTQQGRMWPYQGLAAAIRDAIRSGELPPGQRLPAQQRLAQMAGVSKSAVQNALAVLRDEGLIQTVPRLGTFVAEPEAE
jgi:GntR family transcriptional regulator